MGRIVDFETERKRILIKESSYIGSIAIKIQGKKIKESKYTIYVIGEIVPEDILKLLNSILLSLLTEKSIIIKNNEEEILNREFLFEISITKDRNYLVYEVCPNISQELQIILLNELVSRMKQMKQ